MSLVNTHQDETALQAEELRVSQELLFTVESRLGEAIPEAQSLLEALVRQEESHEVACKELSEVREMEVVDGRSREETDQLRGHLLSSVESAYEDLQDKLDKEREHFDYHEDHGAALEAQIGELRDYTELRDKQYEQQRAELKNLRFELQEQGIAAPSLLAARQEQDMYCKFEARLNREQLLREQAEKELRDLQAEMEAVEDHQQLGMEMGVTPSFAASVTSTGSIPSTTSMRPALRQPKSEGFASTESGVSRRNPGRSVSFDEKKMRSAVPIIDDRGDDSADIQDEAFADPVPLPSAAGTADLEASMQVRIELDHTTGSPLGVHINPDTLKIDEIEKDGLMSAWNCANPTKTVGVGDRLLEVNGARNSPEEIIRECQEPNRLLMTLEKQGSVSAQTRDSDSRRSSPLSEQPADASRQRRPSASELSAGRLSRGEPPPRSSLGDRRDRGDPSKQRPKTPTEDIEEIQSKLAEDKRTMRTQQIKPRDLRSSTGSQSSVSSAPKASTMRKAPSKAGQGGTTERRSHDSFSGSLRG
jgi:hypothetical protein